MFFNYFIRIEHTKNGDYMKNTSIWSDYKQKNICSKLDKDLEVDVLIIGGGITGMSSAYHLINSGLKVCLVEKETIASGVTSRTTGKLTFLQENIYSKICKFHNKEKALKYLESQKDAIGLVCKIIKDNNIKCDLEKANSYLFDDKKIKELNNEIELLKELKVNIKETNILPNGKIVNKGCYVSNTYVFHPLKYLYSLKNIILKNNISIYENTKVVSINKVNDIYECITENHKIKSKYVVLALHYPYFLIPFFMPLKGYIEKSYIEAFKCKDNLKFSAINISKPTLSMRYHNDYELFLTNSHNACIKENDKENFEGLLKCKRIKPDYIWSNKDIITNDLLPFIGSVNKDKTMLIGTGYNTWGMTNGSLAGKILSDIILKKENNYIELFNPLRKINAGKIISFPLILGSNAYSFIKSKVRKNKRWYPNNVIFEKRNGKNVAVYIDNEGSEHVVYNLCPHLKCSLNFNELEKTWDCPCHGSRFDIDGNSIEGPSNYNITYKD